MDALLDFLATYLPEIFSVIVVIIFARMGWRVWKTRGR